MKKVRRNFMKFMKILREEKIRNILYFCLEKMQ